jgi:hypothetical protein
VAKASSSTADYPHILTSCSGVQRRAMYSLRLVVRWQSQQEEPAVWHRRLISGLAVLAVLVAACSAGLADAESVSPDADLGQFVRAFSPCDGFDDVSNASGHLLISGSWLEVTDLIDIPEGIGVDIGSGLVEGRENGAGQVATRRVDAH